MYLRFEGIESCGEVYVNGSFVGYSAGSFTPAEYDITDYAVNGENPVSYTHLDVYKRQSQA